MTLEEAKRQIPPGRYRHFKGNEYEVLDIAQHSETEEPMVVYRALYGRHGLWVRPAEMWLETVERDGYTFRRFTRVRPAGRYVAFDVETPNSRNDRMSAIGVTVIEDGEIAEEFYTLVNPETRFDPFNIQLTGITPAAVETELRPGRPGQVPPRLWHPLADKSEVCLHGAHEPADAPGDRESPAQHHVRLPGHRAGSPPRRQ